MDISLRQCDEDAEIANGNLPLIRQASIPEPIHANAAHSASGCFYSKSPSHAIKVSTKMQRRDETNDRFEQGRGRMGGGAEKTGEVVKGVEVDADCYLVE